MIINLKLPITSVSEILPSASFGVYGKRSNTDHASATPLTWVSTVSGDNMYVELRAGMWRYQVPNSPPAQKWFKVSINGTAIGTHTLYGASGSAQRLAIGSINAGDTLTIEVYGRNTNSTTNGWYGDASAFLLSNA